jgi:hypothetical protein
LPNWPENLYQELATPTLSQTTVEPGRSSRKPEPIHDAAFVAAANTPPHKAILTKTRLSESEFLVKYIWKTVVKGIVRPHWNNMKVG